MNIAKKERKKRNRLTDKENKLEVISWERERKMGKKWVGIKKYKINKLQGYINKEHRE